MAAASEGGLSSQFMPSAVTVLSRVEHGLRHFFKLLQLSQQGWLGVFSTGILMDTVASMIG